MGWFFLSLAVAASISSLAQHYAVYGLVTRWQDPLPGARFMGWLQSWFQHLSFPAPIALPYLFFPDGKLPSARWRPVAWLAAIGTVLISLRQLIDPGGIYVYISDPPVALNFDNPTGVIGLARLLDRLLLPWLLALVPLPLALFAPIFRFRRASGVERQQLKWFVYFGALILLLIPLSFFGGPFLGEVILGVMILMLPVATAISILRYRLWEIDVIIRRTLIYGAVTGVLALVYLASIVFLQQVFRTQSQIATVLSTLAIAALFSPLRRRVQNNVDRVFLPKEV